MNATFGRYSAAGRLAIAGPLCANEVAPMTSPHDVSRSCSPLGIQYLFRSSAQKLVSNSRPLYDGHPAVRLPTDRSTSVDRLWF